MSKNALIERGFAVKDGNIEMLLIFPSTSISHRYGKADLGDLGGDLIPLGIASIAAFLREKGYGVGVLDCCALRLSNSEILDIIQDKKPRIVGLSSTTYALPSSITLANTIRKEVPDQLIILGGSHANVAGEETIDEYDAFDLVAVGPDGEYTALEIIEAYKASGYSRSSLLSRPDLLSTIDGIYYSDSGKTIRTKPRSTIADLDQLPLPARDLFPMERYIPLPNQYKTLPLTNIVVIRGCPYACTFCDQASTSARTRSPEKTINEIRHCVEEYGIKEISFWDDTMSYNKKWMSAFCELLIDANLDVIWSCYAAVNTVNQEILHLMKKAGCWNIFYGFETGVTQLLRNIDAHKKNRSFEKMKEVSQWTKDAGIEIRGSFMLGLPGETPDLAKETIKKAIALDPEYAQFSITTPYPGTRLYKEIKSGKWGKFTTMDFSEFQGWNVVFLPEGYTDKDEVWAMERSAFRQFYFRPKYIAKKIFSIRSKEDIKRYIKGGVALLGGFAFGPMPKHVRIKTGRTP
jgi:radical SAM superfamily enzyme YgiQ (UPF0313 family)|tara:strand:+ start:4082 stop:5638 length:1557 start_codon:yes stop_codon:yes gene_type:complete